MLLDGAADALLGQATVALRRNRHDEAERLLREVLLRIPDSVEAQTSLGIVLQRTNRLEEAESFEEREKVLIEQFVPGRELTVAIMGDKAVAESRERVRAALGDVLDAFAHNDVAKAREVWERDEDIDQALAKT